MGSSHLQLSREQGAFVDQPLETAVSSAELFPLLDMSWDPTGSKSQGTIQKLWKDLTTEEVPQVSKGKRVPNIHLPLYTVYIAHIF